MKKIKQLITLSVLFFQVSCVHSEQITNYSRWIITIHSNENISSQVRSIGDVLLKNNFTESNIASNNIRLYIHLKYEAQTVKIFSEKDSIKIDAVLFKSGLFQSCDPKAALLEIIKSLTDHHGRNSFDVKIKDNVEPRNEPTRQPTALDVPTSEKNEVG